MPSYRIGRVTEILEERSGLQRLRVDLGGESPERAYGLDALVPPAAPGDEVVVNTTAVERDLGTGGWHVVLWNLSAREWSAPGRGHIMKLRYTGLQADTGAVEEQHPVLPSDIGGVPVAVCTVHSQVACVAAAFAANAPGRRLVYVMTDGAALPIALSDLVVGLRERQLLSATLTAGHAFGGDFEAVGVPSALVAAVGAAGADAVVVGMGPGVVGTGTSLGTTALEAAPVLDAVHQLGGRSVMALRASSGDARDRHAGLSHHVEGVLRLRCRPTVLPVVPGIPADDRARLAAVAVEGDELVEVDAPPIAEWLAAADLRVTTMGRGVEEDLLFFESAAAAGVQLAQRLGEPGRAHA